MYSFLVDIKFYELIAMLVVLNSACLCMTIAATSYYLHYNRNFMYLYKQQNWCTLLLVSTIIGWWNYLDVSSTK